MSGLNNSFSFLKTLKVGILFVLLLFVLVLPTGNIANAEPGDSAANAGANIAGFPDAGETYATSDGVVDEPANPLGGFGDTIFRGLAYMTWGVFTVAAFFMGIAGVLLNLSVNMFILDFGGSFAGSSGMLVAWDIMRSVANLVLLFTFIFLALSSFISLANFDAKRAIPKLLIFAVLLNFSYLGTAFIVDITNAVSSSIYAQALPSDTSCTDAANTNLLGTIGSGCLDRVGISGTVLEASGMSGVLSTNDATRETIAEKAEDPLQEFVLYLFMTVFALVSTFVFGLIAMFLLTRAITLIFLLVTSPIGFVGLAVPSLESEAHKWWKAFFDNVLFAFIALLLILVAIKIASGISTGGPLLLNQAQNGDALGITSIAVYLVIMGLMVAAVTVAKNFSIFGATTVMNAGNKVRNAASGMFAKSPDNKNATRPQSKPVRAPLQDGASRNPRSARNALAPIPSAQTPRRSVVGNVLADIERTTPRTNVTFKAPTPSGRINTGAAVSRDVAAGRDVSSSTSSPQTTKQRIERIVTHASRMANASESAKGGLLKAIQEVEGKVALAETSAELTEKENDYILAVKERNDIETKLKENEEAIARLSEKLKNADSEEGTSPRVAELESERRELQELKSNNPVLNSRALLLDARVNKLRDEFVKQRGGDSSNDTAQGTTANDNRDRVSQLRDDNPDYTKALFG